MFYTFNQNNSGGSFDFDKEKGLTHIVIIEAENKDKAVEKALDIGIYFGGVEEGYDCPCCGDRWYEPWKDEGTENPDVYGQNPRGKVVDGMWVAWMKPGHEIAIHNLDGSIEWHGVKP